MTNGKVLSLYMTMPDMIRAGHRMRVEDMDCDENASSFVNPLTALGMVETMKMELSILWFLSHKRVMTL